MFVILKENISSEQKKEFLRFLDDLHIIYEFNKEEDKRAIFIVKTLTDEEKIKIVQHEHVEEITLALDREKARLYGTPFFPHHLLKEITVVFIVLAVIIFLSSMFPAPLHEKADPTQSVHAKPEWYFLPLYQGLKYLDIVKSFVSQNSADFIIGLLNFLIPALIVLLMLVFPFIERSKNPRTVRFVKLIATFIFIGIIILGFLGYISGELSEKLFGIHIK